jgi:hypothetical protein
MRLADLSPERRAWLATARWDRIIEKHEGPEDWRWEFRKRTSFPPKSAWTS